MDKIWNEETVGVKATDSNYEFFTKLALFAQARLEAGDKKITISLEQYHLLLKRAAMYFKLKEGN